MVPDPAPRAVLVDGTNALYRAFFAPMQDLRAPDGTPTKAVLVFANMLLKTLREEAPDWCAVAFDPRGKSFRHEVFPEYKAGRDAQPEDLSAQFPLARELVEALALPIVEVPGYEADDVIATLVEQAPAECADLDRLHRPRPDAAGGASASSCWMGSATGATDPGEVGGALRGAARTAARRARPGRRQERQHPPA